MHGVFLLLGLVTVGCVLLFVGILFAERLAARRHAAGDGAAQPQKQEEKQ